MGATGVTPERGRTPAFLEDQEGCPSRHRAETKPRDLQSTDRIRLTQEAILSMMTICTVS